MNVQKFLQEKGWQALTDELAVIVKEYDNGLRVLNYDQIESPKNHPVVNECRGLILNENFEIVCRPFSRFFNYGECDTKEKFHFEDVTVYEKCDGSLVKMYFCNKTGRWELGTRGSAYAEVNHVFSLADGGTFREWILKAMHFTEDQFQSCMNNQEFHKSCTYVMEYIGPENRIVTRYDSSMVVLLAVISNITGIEAHTSGLNDWYKLLFDYGMNVRLPNVYNLRSADDCLRAVEDLPSTQEGYVVLDNITGMRVKIKSPAYVALHRLRGNGAPTFNNIAELVLLNEHEEYLTVFEAERPLFQPLVDALENMLEQMTLAYDDFKDIETQKDFAMKVKDLPFSGTMFTARKLQCSVSHAFNESSMSQKINLLKNFMSVKSE